MNHNGNMYVINGTGKKPKETTNYYRKSKKIDE